MIGETLVKSLRQDSARLSLLKTLLRRSSSAAPQTVTETEENITSRPLPVFKTNENNPVNHTSQHEGRYYTVEPSIAKKLYTHGGVIKEFSKQVQTFGEHCMMVRQPALEIMSYLKAANYSDPVIRYVLYGQLGAGKTMTLAHLLHYAYNQGFILVHNPWPRNWFHRPREVVDSPTKEGFVDLPIDAAAWLIHFKTQNSETINRLNLTLGQEYVWSKRETTAKGAPLMDLVDLGIARIKYACDIIAALLSEIKQSSELGKCKTLVAIDGFNTFFYQTKWLKRANKTIASTEHMSLTEPFLNMTKHDWCNGAVVVIADKLAVGFDRGESDLPRYQFGVKGFDLLDPFIPVEVTNYSEKEMESCISYYIERKWIFNSSAGSERGRKELAFLSGRNPFELMKICSSL